MNHSDYLIFVQQCEKDIRDHAKNIIDKVNLNPEKRFSNTKYLEHIAYVGGINAAVSHLAKKYNFSYRPLSPQFTPWKKVLEA